MSRHYTVLMYKGDSIKPVVSVKFDDAEEALGNFISCLATAGHDERKVDQMLRTWTVTLMKGADGFAVLDPDFNGSVQIKITTK